MFSVNEFKKFYQLVDGFVSDEAETFKFRFLLQALYDCKFKQDVEWFIEKMHATDSSEVVEENFINMRKLCVEKIKNAERETDEDKRMDCYLGALAYFCLLEAFNENSAFSEEIEQMIIRDFGKNYLEVLKRLDKENVSKDVKQRNFIEQDKKIEQSEVFSSDTAQKYLIMKKWQDEQRSFSLQNIRPFYAVEKKYIKENEDNLMKLHRKTLIKRAMHYLSKLELISLDLLSCYYIAGVREELVSLVGGKALGLAMLNSEGYNVPSAWVIPIGRNINQETFAVLDKRMKYAVRSSASCEDGITYSFAGIFDSFLDVSFENLAERVKDVLDSIDNQRVKKYLEIHEIKKYPEMAVIIQSYIEPDKAGVWMGVQREEGVFEWCEGNGAKLVSGKVIPKSLIWKGTSKTEREGEKVFDKIACSIIAFQNAIGEIADIEWCIKGDQIYFLQYRPITKQILEQIQKEYKMETSVIVGVPVSGGCVSGNAKFLGKNFREVEWIDGDILLAWFADPDWLDILENASGLVTAVGGMLCHAAIIARELEIPCVTGIGGKNMKCIWNGGRLEVDGDNGTVRILKEQ